MLVFVHREYEVTADAAPSLYPAEWREYQRWASADDVQGFLDMLMEMRGATEVLDALGAEPSHEYYEFS
jgi:hypothetical protein